MLDSVSDLFDINLIKRVGVGCFFFNELLRSGGHTHRMHSHRTGSQNRHCSGAQQKTEISICKA